MNATTVAVDLAKDVFEVARANRAGRIFERKRLTRRQFERFIDELEPGTDVVMEACGTAHYWGRRCQARDVRVRLMPARYVRPYVRRNKTDRADTEALLEADRCGGLQPVPVKTVEQQTLQALHRVRTQWQTEKEAIHKLQGLREAIEVARNEIEKAQRAGDLSRAAELKFAAWLGALKTGPVAVDAVLHGATFDAAA